MTSRNLIRPEKRIRRRKRFRPYTLAVYALLLAWALTTIFPFVWVLNNSFKTTNLIISDSFMPALWNTVRYDRYGTLVREKVLLDEHDRIIYSRFQTDSQGRIVYEGDTGLPAYDKKNGKIVYDETSPVLVFSPTLVNYIEAFTNPNISILRGYANSLIISGTVTLAVMLLSTMMAFGLARYQFRGRRLLHQLVVAALMFPAFSTIVPVYRMIVKIGLFNRLGGVILVQTASNLAFAVTVMMAYLSALPQELEEAAFMEGANIYRIFWRIIMPLSSSAMATVSIFTFLWSYNDLFVQMVLLRSKSVLPVSAILREIHGQFGTDYGLMAASVIVVILPVLIVYSTLQKYIITGLTAGALKG